jgi:hypothetical protein
MLKTRNNIIKQNYEKEMRACSQVMQRMKAKEKSVFLKVRKVFK